MKPVEFSKLDAKTMFGLYNEHAAKIGAPPMKKRPKDRIAMAKELALILTRRPPPPVKFRDVVIQELCKVEYHELPDGSKADKASHETRSVGATYTEVLARIKVRLPASRISRDSLFVHANCIRNNKKGYDKAKLPDKRPHSKGKDR